MFARSLSEKLHSLGIGSVLCFPALPSPPVAEFLKLPNVVILSEPAVFDSRVQTASLAFLKLVAAHQPSVVHLHFMPFLSQFPWLAKLRGTNKIFITDHSSLQENEVAVPVPGWKRALKLVIQKPVERVITVSDFVLQTHLALKHLPEERFQRIYNGVDLERVRQAEALPSAEKFREKFGIPSDAVLISQVSWLIPQKGVADLIAAAPQVIAACPKAHFCVAGEGPCLEEHLQAVADSGLMPHFTFTGQIADPFFEGLFRATDIVCQPSRWQEAFCWVLGEAMAFGLPIVATRSGAIPELVTDGLTGFTTACRDTDGIARSLITLCADPYLRSQMGKAARAEVQKRFSLEQNTAEHLALYLSKPR